MAKHTPFYRVKMGQNVFSQWRRNTQKDEAG